MIFKKTNKTTQSLPFFILANIQIGTGSESQRDCETELCTPKNGSTQSPTQVPRSNPQGSNENTMNVDGASSPNTLPISILNVKYFHRHMEVLHTPALNGFLIWELIHTKELLAPTFFPQIFFSPSMLKTTTFVWFVLSFFPSSHVYS